MTDTTTIVVTMGLLGALLWPAMGIVALLAATGTLDRIAGWLEGKP